MGLDFLYRYLQYFLRLIFPFGPKSVAAWLNISNYSGPVFISVVLYFSVESNRRGTLVVVEGLLASIWSCGTNTGDRISSSGGAWDSGETETGVITFSFSLFCEDVSSGNMGNKEFSVGVFSFKEGINFTKFPTVEVVREAFLLYHMNMIPMATTHMPTVINEAKISLGDNENG